MLQSYASDPLKTSILAEAALGLLASAWAHGDPTLALALFGMVALESQQSLVPLFIFGNAFSIPLDVARLLIARHAFAYGLLFIIQVAVILCKAYVSYQCYDLFGFSGEQLGGSGDGSEYQAAAVGPRADPFRYEAPPQPPPPAQNLYAQQHPQPAEHVQQSSNDPAM